jgi:hypothetical protein
VIILMFCAEVWAYDSVVHEREQTYHSTRMCFELRSVGSKAVSFLPSRPDANLISGVEQEPKSAPEEVELRREAPGVELGVELGRGDDDEV